MDPIPSTGRLEISVVVGIFAVSLSNIVIHVLSRQFGLDRFNPKGFKFKHGHSARGVLKQGVINPDGYLLTRNTLPSNQVLFQYLLSQIFSVHFFSQLKSE